MAEQVALSGPPRLKGVLAAKWKALVHLLSATKLTLATYFTALLIAALAPDKQHHYGWSTAIMVVSMALVALTYLLGLMALRNWLARINTRSSYASLWWSYLVTTMLLQQPLWLICQKFRLISSHAALDNAYFTLVTFLTIGYGDFVPLGGDGRIFAMAVGLMGTAHNICFVAYLLNPSRPRSI